MKHLLLTTIAAVLVVGCGESQQSAPAPEAKPVEPVAKAPDMSIYLSIQNGLIAAVKQHLAAGTDVNSTDEEGGTPLHYAASNARDEIVELLVAEGADVNAKKDDGVTPLHLANSKKIVELLIAKGADVNAKEDDGRTPLDWAVEEAGVHEQIEIIAVLRKHGGKTSEALKAEGK